MSVVPCRKPLVARSQCSGRPGESRKADVVVLEEHMIRESLVANCVCADPLHYSAGVLRVQFYYIKSYCRVQQKVIYTGHLTTN